MEIKVHDSGEGHASDERFTAHAGMREDVASVSVVEVELEAYGPTADIARSRLRAAMRDLAEELLSLSK